MFVGNIGNVEIPKITKYIDENVEFSIGDKKIKVISTPGHTVGGVCYFVDDKLFTGDTIFLESIGRTDLPTGNLKTLRQSLKKLAALTEDYPIYPGHEESTTLFTEKKRNPFLRGV